MEKLTGLVEKYLLPLAEKLSSNKYLSAVSSGFQTMLPMIMVGAIFTLFQTLQIGPYQAFIKALHLDVILGFAPAVTTNMLAIYGVAFIAYALIQNSDDKQDALVNAGLAIMIFMLMIPQGVTGLAKDGVEVVTVSGAYDTRFLGAPGLFSAIIIGLLVPTIYQWITKRGWVIKMPDGVPPAVAKSFNSLIPAFIICILFSLVRYGFSLTSFKNFNLFVYTILQEPLLSVGTSPIAFIILIFCCSFFWFFGIHGGQIVNPIISAVYLPLAVENLDALQKGVAQSNLPNLISQSCWLVYSSIGGGGCTIGLVICMLLFAKSSRYKQLGRLAAPASLCGINEPITFGLPIVLNPVMLIPFIITPIVTFTTAYLCTVVGIVPPLNGVQIQVGTPILLSAWMTGGLKIMILQFVLVLVSTCLYFPFFKTLDNKALEEEKELEEKNA